MTGSTTDQQGSFRFMLDLPVKIRPATTVLREGPCQHWLATHHGLLDPGASVRDFGGTPSDRICEASPEPKTGLILGHQLWHTTCPFGDDAVLAALLYRPPRGGRSGLNLSEREQVHHVK